MKNILRNAFLALIAVALGSCEEKDLDPVAVAAGGPKLTISDIPLAGLVLDQAAPSTLVASLNWEPSDNGVITDANYTVELAKAGTNFATIILAGTSPNKFANFTNKQLNDLLPAPTFAPFTQVTLDVRVKSTLGTGANALVQYSNVIKIKVTPYTTELPKLGVPGDHQSPDVWKPTHAPSLPLMASSGFGMKDFEGYMTLNTACKFLAPKADGTFDWGTQDWGDDGTFAGTLTDTNEQNLSVTPGYYLVKANTATTGPGALQYSATPIVWHITGDATPLSWPDPATNGNNSTPMSYDTTTKKWTISILLTGGKDIKFRANNSWSLNIGAFDASKTGDKYGGKDMSYDGGNIRIATTGTYTVTLDMSNPRAYKYSVN